MRKALLNTALLLVSLAVAFAIGEFAVRLLFKDSTVLFPRYHTDYRYGSYVLRGTRPNAEFWHSSVDGRWKFVTNSKGLRDTREFPYDKPSGTLRVLALGDSHTQGYEVRQEATYAAVLERYLDVRGLQSEVLNAGVSGFSTAEELAFLENEGFRYDPDVVVLGFYANDFQDNSKAALFAVRDDKLVAVKREHVPGVRVQNVIYRIPGVHWLSEHSYLYSLVFNSIWIHFKSRLAEEATHKQGAPAAAGEDAFERAVAQAGDASDAEVDLAAHLIARMRDACAARGALLLVVDIPTLASTPAAYRSSLPRALIDRLDKAGILHIDSDAFLRDYGGAVELHVPHGSRHISEFTHGMIGVELGRRIRHELDADSSGEGPSASQPHSTRRNERRGTTVTGP